MFPSPGAAGALSLSFTQRDSIWVKKLLSCSILGLGCSRDFDTWPFGKGSSQFQEKNPLSFATCWFPVSTRSHSSLDQLGKTSDSVLFASCPLAQACIRPCDCVGRGEPRKIARLLVWVSVMFHVQNFDSFLEPEVRPSEENANHVSEGVLED